MQCRGPIFGLNETKIELHGLANSISLALFHHRSQLSTHNRLPYIRIQLPLYLLAPSSLVTYQSPSSSSTFPPIPPTPPTTPYHSYPLLPSSPTISPCRLYHYHHFASIIFFCGPKYLSCPSCP